MYSRIARHEAQARGVERQVRWRLKAWPWLLFSAASRRHPASPAPRAPPRLLDRGVRGAMRRTGSTARGRSPRETPARARARARRAAAALGAPRAARSNPSRTTRPRARSRFATPAFGEAPRSRCGLAAGASPRVACRRVRRGVPSCSAVATISSRASRAAPAARRRPRELLARRRDDPRRAAARSRPAVRARRPARRARRQRARCAGAARRRGAPGARGRGRGRAWAAGRASVRSRSGRRRGRTAEGAARPARRSCAACAARSVYPTDVLLASGGDNHTDVAHVAARARRASGGSVRTTAGVVPDSSSARAARRRRLSAPLRRGRRRRVRLLRAAVRTRRRRARGRRAVRDGHRARRLADAFALTPRPTARVLLTPPGWTPSSGPPRRARALARARGRAERAARRRHRQRRAGDQHRDGGGRVGSGTRPTRRAPPLGGRADARRRLARACRSAPRPPRRRGRAARAARRGDGRGERSRRTRVGTPAALGAPRAVVVVHSVASSKAGLLTPSLACLAGRRAGGERVVGVVGACQVRGPPRAGAMVEDDGFVVPSASSSSSARRRSRCLAGSSRGARGRGGRRGRHHAGPAWRAEHGALACAELSQRVRRRRAGATRAALGGAQRRARCAGRGRRAARARASAPARGRAWPRPRRGRAARGRRRRARSSRGVAYLVACRRRAEQRDGADGAARAPGPGGSGGVRSSCARRARTRSVSRPARLLPSAPLRPVGYDHGAARPAGRRRAALPHRPAVGVSGAFGVLRIAVRRAAASSCAALKSTRQQRPTCSSRPRPTRPSSRRCTFSPCWPQLAEADAAK